MHVLMRSVLSVSVLAGSEKYLSLEHCKSLVVLTDVSLSVIYYISVISVSLLVLVKRVFIEVCFLTLVEIYSVL